MPRPKPEVELDAVEVDAVVAPACATRARSDADRVGGERLVLAAEAVEDVGRRPLQVGQGVDLVADPLQDARAGRGRGPTCGGAGGRSRAPERRPVTTGTSVRKRRSIPPSSARSTDAGISAGLGLARLEPAGELLEAQLERLGRPSPRSAASLSISIRADPRRLGQARALRASPGSGRRGRGGSSPLRPRPRPGPSRRAR